MKDPNKITNRKTKTKRGEKRKEDYKKESIPPLENASSPALPPTRSENRSP
jgi:hypothetical protein